MVIGVAETEGIPLLPPKGIEKERIDLIQKEIFQYCKNNDLTGTTQSTTTISIYQKNRLNCSALCGTNNFKNGY